MGVIKQQSIKSTFITYIGFAIGAINMLFVMPSVFSKEQFGLIQVFISFAIQAVTVGSLGMVVVSNKFIPYYKSLLPPQKRDLLSIALITGTIGMLCVLGISYLNEDLIIRKLSKNAPLFIEYMYLFPLFALGYFYSYILDSFNINYQFSVWSAFVREVFYRAFNLFTAVIFALGILSFSGVINLYMVIYWLGAILLCLNLYYHKVFHVSFRISDLTRRIWKKMVRYSISSWSVSILSTTLQFIETLAIAGLIGLGPAAVYSIAKFLISPVIIPATSVITVSIPVISDSWRRHDLVKIEEIYKKSALALVSICGFLFFLISVNAFNIFQLIPHKFFESDMTLITQAFWVVIILGFGRIIDFSTSVNSYILQTSSKYFPVDLLINLIAVILSIPLNYFLIKNTGIIGAALAYLFLSLITNTYKTYFLYHKESIHPFSKKWLTLIFIFIVSGITGFLLNISDKFYFELFHKSFVSILLLIAVKCLILAIIYIPLNLRFDISPDINTTIRSFLNKAKAFLK